jgi:hypothetical protein
VRVVDQAGGQEFADGGRAAADADIPARRGLARLRKRLVGAGVEEVKGGVYPALDSDKARISADMAGNSTASMPRQGRPERSFCCEFTRIKPGYEVCLVYLDGEQWQG